MKCAIIIPSRYGSSRLPAKALADIDGKSLVQWVFEACKKVSNANKVIIATDHPLIEKAAQDFGADVMMTSSAHQSGTDRCAEVAQNLDVDFIINVQGDEPFIDPKTIEVMIRMLGSNPKIEILTLFHKMRGQDEIADPSKVKLVLDNCGRVLYFSRSPIPYQTALDSGMPFYKHVGLYAFRKEALLSVSKMPVSSLEKAERLEQLRWMENGMSIHGLEIAEATLGVDTPEDLEKARAFARNYC